MDRLSLRAGVAAMLLAASCALALVATGGAWSAWEIDASFFGARIEWRLEEVSNGAGGARRGEAYGEDAAPVEAAFDVTALLVLGGALAAAAAAGASALAWARPMARAAAPWLAAVAGVALAAAPLHLVVAFPAAVAATGADAEEGPGASFWGSDEGASWGAGPSWYACVLAALLALAGARLARVTRTRPPGSS